MDPWLNQRLETMMPENLYMFQAAIAAAMQHTHHPLVICLPALPLPPTDMPCKSSSTPGCSTTSLMPWA